MSDRSDFTAEEWDRLREGPASAGMLVILAHRGGSVRETVSMAKVYAEAQQQHGHVDLLGQIVADKPEVDKKHGHSTAEVRAGLLDDVGEAVKILAAKATPSEVDAYKAFTMEVAMRVATARREGFMGLRGELVGPEERQALEAVAGVLEVPVPTIPEA